MGPAQSSILAAVGTAGVAASKIAQGISEPNDAKKNEMMAEKAKMNAEKLKQLKLKNKEQRAKIKILTQTIEKNTLKRKVINNGKK